MPVSSSINRDSPLGKGNVDCSLRIEAHGPRKPAKDVTWNTGKLWTHNVSFETLERSACDDLQSVSVRVKRTKKSPAESDSSGRRSESFRNADLRECSVTRTPISIRMTLHWQKYRSATLPWVGATTGWLKAAGPVS